MSGGGGRCSPSSPGRLAAPGGGCGRGPPMWYLGTMQPGACRSAGIHLLGCELDFVMACFVFLGFPYDA